MRLTAMDEHDTSSNCTDINGAVERSLRRAAAIVLLSDGISDCPGAKRVVPVPKDTWLLFVRLRPRRQTGPSQAAFDWQRLFPGSTAVLASEATESFWHGVAELRRTGAVSAR